MNPLQVWQQLATDYDLLATEMEQAADDDLAAMLPRVEALGQRLQAAPTQVDNEQAGSLQALAEQIQQAHGRCVAHLGVRRQATIGAHLRLRQTAQALKAYAQPQPGHARYHDRRH